MTRIDLWTIIIGGMVVTYLIRLSFIFFIPPDRMPSLFRRGLRYVPPAVLAALIAPDLMIIDGTLQLSFTNHRLIAGIQTRNVICVHDRQPCAGTHHE